MIDTKGKKIEEVAEEMFSLLVKQGGRCLNKWGKCSYGDGNGNHCAVGWLFPKGDIRLMEAGDTIESLGEEEDLGPNGEFIKEHLEDLLTLQVIHDLDSKPPILGRSYKEKQLEHLEDLSFSPTPSIFKWIDQQAEVE